MTSTVTPKHFTSHQDFFRANAEGNKLFAVNAGVPAKNALEQASCLLAAARGVSHEVADPDSDAAKADSAYAVIYLLEMAKAIIDSLTNSLSKEQA